MNNIFKDINVIELANVLAGPAIGQFFAELGANVIKVENTLTKGDVTRSWKLPTEDESTDISAYFSCVNWGKKSIAINIKKKEGVEIIYKLIKKSDILISSYKPGDAEKLGMDYDSLSKINDRIIYAHITGYGNDNPRAGYDAIIQAESGFTYMNGEPDSKSTKMPVALMDVLAAHQIKEAILIALLNREKTGKGCKIDASLFQSGVASLANQAANWLVGNTIPERMGSDHPNIVPYGSIFNTLDDGQIVLAVGTDKQFTSLCEVLSISDITGAPEYKTNYHRVKNKEILLNKLQERILTFRKNELLELLNNKKVPAGSVNNMKEVFEQPESSEILLSCRINEELEIKGVRSLIARINNKLPGDDLLPPPKYSEHTLRILQEELNLDITRINYLKEVEVIDAT